MKPHQIKCAVVAQMWQDGISQGRRYADIETVAEYAVPPAYYRDAVEEIEDWMISDDDCPIAAIAQGIITLVGSDEEVYEYLCRVCDDEDSIPWRLRDKME